MSRFGHVKFTPVTSGIRNRFRFLFEKIEDYIHINLEPGRNTARALTHLEDAYTAVSKALRDDQVAAEKKRVGKL